MARLARNTMCWESRKSFPQLRHVDILDGLNSFANHGTGTASNIRGCTFVT